MAAIHINCKTCKAHVDLIRQKLRYTSRPDTPLPSACGLEGAEETAWYYDRYGNQELSELCDSLFDHINGAGGPSKECTTGMPVIVSICSTGIGTIEKKATTMDAKYINDRGQRCTRPIKGIYGRLFLRNTEDCGKGVAFKLLHSEIEKEKAEKGHGDGSGGIVVPGTLEHESFVYQQLLLNDSKLARDTVCGGAIVLCRYDAESDANDVYTIGESAIGKCLHVDAKDDPLPWVHRALYMPIMGMPMNLLSSYLSELMTTGRAPPGRVNAGYGVRLVVFRVSQRLLKDMHRMGWIHGDFKLDNLMTTDRWFMDQRCGSRGIELMRMVEFLQKANTTSSTEQPAYHAQEVALGRIADHMNSELRLIDLGLSQRIDDPPIRFGCVVLGNKYPGISSLYYNKMKQDLISEIENCKAISQYSRGSVARKMSQVTALRHVHPFMDWVALVGSGLELINTNRRFSSMWDQLKNAFTDARDYAWQNSWLAKVRDLLCKVREDKSEYDACPYRDILIDEIERLAVSTVKEYNLRISRAMDALARDEKNVDRENISAKKRRKLTQSNRIESANCG